MRTDVVIVGAGLAGSAAARELSRRGREVVVLEAFEPGHRRGSSHGSARIYRRAYADPLFVRMTGTSGLLWRELSDEAGEQLVRVTGELDFGPTDGPAKVYEQLTANGVPAEQVTLAEAVRRWPGFAFAPDDKITFHPEAGVIDSDAAMTAMRRLAAARGAMIKHSTPVLHLEAGPEGGIAHTADGTFEAPVIVVAAGAWVASLLGDLVRLPPLEVTQTQAFNFEQRFAGGENHTPRPATLPAVTDSPGREGPSDPPQPGDAKRARRGANVGADNDRDDTARWPTFIYHGFPPVYGLLSGRDGEVAGALKVGVHGQGTVTTADDRDFIPNPVARDQVLQFVRNKIPGLLPDPVGELTCLYTSTANEDFILDRQGPFVVCSPCSGHGAKFAPLVGQIVADLTEGKPPEYPRFTLASHLGTAS